MNPHRTIWCFMVFEISQGSLVSVPLHFLTRLWQIIIQTTINDEIIFFVRQIFQIFQFFCRVFCTSVLYPRHSGTHNAVVFSIRDCIFFNYEDGCVLVELSKPVLLQVRGSGSNLFWRHFSRLCVFRIKQSSIADSFNKDALYDFIPCAFRSRPEKVQMCTR